VVTFHLPANAEDEVAGLGLAPNPSVVGEERRLEKK